eukprot:gene651-biopygen332
MGHFILIDPTDEPYGGHWSPETPAKHYGNLWGYNAESRGVMEDHGMELGGGSISLEAVARVLCGRAYHCEFLYHQFPYHRVIGLIVHRPLVPRAVLRFLWYAQQEEQPQRTQQHGEDDNADAHNVGSGGRVADPPQRFNGCSI